MLEVCNICIHPACSTEGCAKRLLKMKIEVVTHRLTQGLTHGLTHDRIESTARLQPQRGCLVAAEQPFDTSMRPTVPAIRMDTPAITVLVRLTPRLALQVRLPLDLRLDTRLIMDRRLS